MTPEAQPGPASPAPPKSNWITTGLGVVVLVMTVVSLWQDPAHALTHDRMGSLAAGIGFICAADGIGGKPKGAGQ